MAHCGSIIKPPTALQQLLEEINFQRTKELRQLQRENGGFVMLQGTTYWTDLFVRHFLFQSEPQHTIDSDDLLFFVRKKHVKGSSRVTPKFDTEIDVFRKDSRKLPIGDPDVDWEETVYLNLVIHQFDYTVTLAICTRTSPKELQVLRRHSQRVYASPSRRKMDTKGDSEEITYPHICFMVDNFDEVFSDILVRDGEMVCVELVASDRDGSVQGVIFLGSIRYDALKKVYDSRQSSLSTKVAQRMTFGLFSAGGPQTRCEFVRMKGPQGKGHAEMAVTKPKGSGVETPTSEPGFSAADMWDSEWDEDPDDFYNYRHQRRLSDPSASLNNFSRYAFRAKSSHDATAGGKARSENEGLDILVNEVSEIEAGDLRDDCPASSVTETKLADGTQMAQSTTIKSSETAIITPPSNCCNCFANRKRWSDSLSGQMSDVYCRTCDEGNLSPSCLVNVVTPSKQFLKNGFNKNVLNVESEIELSPTKKSNKKKLKVSITSNKEIGNGAASGKKCNIIKKQQKNHEAQQATKRSDNNIPGVAKSKLNKNNNKELEYELADDATFMNENNIGANTKDDIIKIGIINDVDSKLMIRVQGKEELPEIQHELHILDNKKISNNYPDPSMNKYNNLIKLIKNDLNGNLGCKFNYNNNNNNNNINPNCSSNNNNNNRIGLSRSYSTLPKRSNRTLNPHTNTDHHLFVNRPSILKIPTRVTPDGTKIYYWCDMSKKILKELDDGAYNPLWATKGFTQTFHFWKEHRRQQSIPLNAFLTYVTLPWWSIAKDLLDHRETPILTF